MSFRITGLSAQPFAHLFGLSDAELAAHGAVRYRGEGLPDRVELRDTIGAETVLLVNHEHQPADTPYRSRHAIFVSEQAGEPFDAAGMMVDADLVDGQAVEDLIARLLAQPDVDYIHAHFARRGCFAALIRRA